MRQAENCAGGENAFEILTCCDGRAEGGYHSTGEWSLRTPRTHQLLCAWSIHVLFMAFADDSARGKYFFVPLSLKQNRPPR